MQLAVRQKDAKVRVVFIGGSDRSVMTDYTGRSDTRGYSVRSEIYPWSVELKREGCADTFEFVVHADCGQPVSDKRFTAKTGILRPLTVQKRLAGNCR